MLGFAHDHETLRNGAENPFADLRVRQAVAHAVNVPAILQTNMRGSAEPAAQLVAAGTSGYSDANGERPRLRPRGGRARCWPKPVTPDGFAFDFSCTNDRYLNDESVCQAIVGMLAQVGLDVTLDAMPVSNYWPQLREGQFRHVPAGLVARHIRRRASDPLPRAYVRRPAGNLEFRGLFEPADRCAFCR